MKAIALVPGTKILRVIDRHEPTVTRVDEVKVRIIRVGICGTDREEAAGGRARVPEGNDDLVIGHEMFGKVVEVGEAVQRVRPGDYAVFTVRRGCGKCSPCMMNRSDMCETGEYEERGIWGIDGYQTEFVADLEQYIVRVPAELESVGVLCEPLSIAEKAITEALRVQLARLPNAPACPDWLFGKRCLVAGLGPVGLLGALALKLRGAEVYGLDIIPANSRRALWLKAIGGRYIDGREVAAQKVADTLGPMDLIFEASGFASLEFSLLDALGLNGIYVLTGIPGSDRMIQIHGADLIRKLVLGNQLMFGSVNAARDHFQMAVSDLEQAYLRWGDSISEMITHRYAPDDIIQNLANHPPDEIKAVVEWSHIG